ncbi:hypothetical protein CHELA20_52191 [Hyphomicrobiales bacterium]|nr:hypothetical protein CHELA41_22728 [Hyphomicrobiales bacterium]CAH1681080.1 hypothetical protein CHELA20_52191 [Hyphomicrobiales bacterium]
MTASATYDVEPQRDPPKANPVNAGDLERRAARPILGDNAVTFPEGVPLRDRFRPNVDPGVAIRKLRLPAAVERLAAQILLAAVREEQRLESQVGAGRSAGGAGANRLAGVALGHAHQPLGVGMVYGGAGTSLDSLEQGHAGVSLSEDGVDDRP